MQMGMSFGLGMGFNNVGSHCRHFHIKSEAWDEIYRTQFTAVFDEDKVVLEGQQKRMNENSSGPKIDINADAPNIQVRRMIDEMIAEEQAEADPQCINA
jgi:phage-related protein